MIKEKDIQSLVESAYRKLKGYMFQQKIVPGQKLLYRELTGLLGMSKTPIVNALNRLEQEGFVISEPNVGFYLKPIDTKEIVDSSEVREVLETRAFQRAVQVGTQKELELLEKKLLDLETYSGPAENKRRLVLNAEFHLQIADMTGNRVLKYLLKRNLEHTILRVNRVGFGKEPRDASHSDHRRLLDMLISKDAEAGVALIQRHIQRTRDRILRSLATESLEEIELMDFFEERRSNR